VPQDIELGTRDLERLLLERVRPSIARQKSDQMA